MKIQLTQNNNYAFVFIAILAFGLRSKLSNWHYFVFVVLYPRLFGWTFLLRTRIDSFEVSSSTYLKNWFVMQKLLIWKMMIFHSDENKTTESDFLFRTVTQYIRFDRLQIRPTLSNVKHICRKNVNYFRRPLNFPTAFHSLHPKFFNTLNKIIFSLWTKFFWLRSHFQVWSELFIWIMHFFLFYRANTFFSIGNISTVRVSVNLDTWNAVISGRSKKK